MDSRTNNPLTIATFLSNCADHCSKQELPTEQRVALLYSEVSLFSNSYHFESLESSLLDIYALGRGFNAILKEHNGHSEIWADLVQVKQQLIDSFIPKGLSSGVDSIDYRDQIIDQLIQPSKRLHRSSPA